MDSRCRYLAQAGAHDAIFDFRVADAAANGFFSLGQTNLDANNYFIRGGNGGNAADWLMVNTVGTALSGGGRNVDTWPIQNANNTKTITIDRMIVSWIKPLPARNLQRIRLNGTTVWTGPAGGLPSPVNANITDFMLNTTPTIYPNNELRFSGSMAGATNVTIQFVVLLPDGSTRTVQVFPATNNNNFTVRSTGKMTGSNYYRTIQAEYNALTSRIIDYDEINTEITAP